MPASVPKNGDTVLHLLFADHLNDKTFFSYGMAQIMFLILLPYLSKKKATNISTIST